MSASKLSATSSPLEELLAQWVALCWVAASFADEQYADKVRAADAALARLLQVRELAQLEARVEALEEATGLDLGGPR